MWTSFFSNAMLYMTLRQPIYLILNFSGFKLEFRVRDGFIKVDISALIVQGHELFCYSAEKKKEPASCKFS